MKYLVIRNEGLINELDLTSLGLSTKRGDSSKIGQFGSGSKFALAYLVRENIPFKIFSGMEEFKIDTETVLHRDQPVSFITINGRKTDITTEFGGIDWECWMALRELISNAMDEPAFALKMQDEYNPAENHTTIVLEMVDPVKQIMVNYHHYFAFDRIASYENSVGKVFIKSDNTYISVYRKGIRCLDSTRKSYVDVNFNNVEINESRLSSEGFIDIQMRRLLNFEVPYQVWEALFKGEYKDWLPVTPVKSALNAIAVLKERYKIECPLNINLLGFLGMGLIEEGKPILLIPNTYYTKAIEEGILERNESLTQIGDTAFLEIDDPRKQETQYYLQNFGFPCEVKFGAMELNKDIIIKENFVLVKASATYTAKQLAVLILQTINIKTALPIFEKHIV